MEMGSLEQLGNRKYLQLPKPYMLFDSKFLNNGATGTSPVLTGTFVFNPGNKLFMPSMYRPQPGIQNFLEFIHIGTTNHMYWDLVPWRHIFEEPEPHLRSTVASVEDEPRPLPTLFCTRGNNLLNSPPGWPFIIMNIRIPTRKKAKDVQPFAIGFGVLASFIHLLSGL